MMILKSILLTRFLLKMFQWTLTFLSLMGLFFYLMCRKRIIKRVITFRDNRFYSATYYYSDGTHLIDYNFPENYKELKK